MNLLSVKNDIINFKSRKAIPNAPSNTLSFSGQGLKLSVLNSDQIAFKGCTQTGDTEEDITNTSFKKLGCKMKDGKSILCHRTRFFIDADTLKFVCDQVKERFSGSTEIWDYGCSNGKEPLSILMLLNPEPTKIDKRYKIKGFDLSEDIIKQAKSGVYSVFGPSNPLDEYFSVISRRRDEYYLYNMYLKKDCTFPDDMKERQKIFDKYFIQIEKPENTELIKYEDKPKNGGKDVFVGLRDELKDDLNAVLTYDAGPEVGNVANVGKRENKAGVIIFKNAWFHLTGNEIYPNFDRTKTITELNFNVVEQTARDMYKKLEDNGLLVVGNLCADQLFYKDPKNKATESIESDPINKDPDNPNLELVKDSPFQEILRRNGFRPIKWEPASALPFLEKQEILVPTVWEKIPEESRRKEQ